MKLRFYIDPATDEPHIHEHGIIEDEVADVLARPGEDRPRRDGSRAVIGLTQNGRYLRVIDVPDLEREVYLSLLRMS